MIELNNIEYRNLEEQVLENKEKIAQHYNIDRVLADFGIRVLGQLDSASDLDNLTGPFEYGDAYAIGTTPPYSFWIWTRGNINTGHPDDYWFDIGDLAIVGPDGPPGPAPIMANNGTYITSTDPNTQEKTNVISIQDIRGSRYYVGSGTPTDSKAPNSKENDWYLNRVDGYLWRKVGDSWAYVMNINGPQGPQGKEGPQGERGEKGDTGDRGPRGIPGSVYTVVAVLDDVDQFPAPEDVGPNDAYLLRTGTEPNYEYNLRAVIDGEWVNLGPIGFDASGPSNTFFTFNDLGKPNYIGLYQHNVIFRNFHTYGVTGGYAGCLNFSFIDSEASYTSNQIYNWLLTNGYTDQARRFYPASGFSYTGNSIEATTMYQYFGVVANPNVEDQFYFVGARYRNDGTEAPRQASFPVNYANVQSITITSRPLIVPQI